MSEIESTLARIGISDKAARTYLACLQIGSATITDIAKAANIKRPTAYLVVEDLIMRGFLSTFKKGAKKYYYPEPPMRILQLLRFRTKELEESMPELEALYNEPKDKPRIRVYEGKEAVMRIYEELYAYLGKKEEALFFTAIGDLEKYFPESVEAYVRQLKKRRDYRIRELNRGDEAGVAYARRMKSVCGRNHFIRCLDPALAFHNTDSLIFAQKLVIFSVRQDIFVVVIESKNIADTYRAMFNAAWRQGREA